MRYIISGFLLFTSILSVCAQIGGRGVYEFLNLPNSARITALGGKQISLKDDDINMTYYNPSLTDSSMKEKLAINYMNYLAGIQWGNVSYMMNNKRFGYLVTGLSYINYGKFIKADDNGIIQGNFTASDYTVYISYSRNIDTNISIGFNLKPVFSQMESYYSFGLVSDWGITYNNPDKFFTAAFVIRNLGTQLKSYSNNDYEWLPLELQLGVTKKLQHAPFRFSFMFHNLQRFDYTYDIEKDENPLFDNGFLDNNDNNTSLGDFADKSLRHFIAGVEFIPTRSFVFRFGYNYQRIKEMQIEDKLGGVGLSWGFGLLLQKFHVNFGHANYHLAGGSNQISIVANLSRLRGI